MSHREFHYRWEYDLEAAPEALWPLVSNTNRFNLDAGVPALFKADEDAKERARGIRRRLGLSKFGVRVTWEEEPFEWMRPTRFGVVRRYTGGPVAEMRVQAELSESERGGTHLVYQVWARPRTQLGRVAIPLQIGLVSARQFAGVFRRYDRLALDDAASLALSARTRIGANERARLANIQAALIDGGAQPELVARLVETVERADDLTLARLRPYALADYWRAPRRAVLELCLQATRAGLLDFRWDLLCPLCRGPNESSATLRDVRSGAHCDSCNIRYTVNFDRSVELTFRPNASVREINVREFCIGGPQVTPHIVVQQLLAAGDSRTIAPALEAGRYRLRAANLEGSRSLVVAADGEPRATLRVEGAAWPDDELRLAPAPALCFENATDGEQLLILERTSWSDQAATAADVTALQLFRDLFATEALRPGDRISVGSLTVVFTDLRGSTRLYREIGDAVAVGAVMNHFDVLRDAIAAEGGAIVKTLGDAVMAVFRQPAPALRAVVRAQAMLAAPPARVRPLHLKAGIHTGPCIAVTLNERLDYFGSNINIAARLEPLSNGQDIIISANVRDDPQVSVMFDAPDAQLRAAPVETVLKGFDAETFSLWRVTPKQST
ncbi:MAG TPA: adenylate/guanylate cyclase domain-containing protein [Pyrinomonadaceae bacterium]|jgi:class 3 adenylate cyclase|nr:adenylate/guanylate cyclase domain-containing protein [Pyrinomonadaceae bacterium]